MTKQPHCNNGTYNYTKMNLKDLVCRLWRRFSLGSTVLQMFHIICMRFSVSIKILTDAAFRVSVDSTKQGVD